MPRLFTNPRFWVLAFVLTWLTVITVLVALAPTVAPTGSAPTPPH